MGEHLGCIRKQNRHRNCRILPYRKYTTDLNLVNDARERTEKLIDKLRELAPVSGPRPRTRPQICRRRFLDVVKHPKCGIGKRRKVLRFLLNTVKRNLGFLREYLKSMDSPPHSLQEQLVVIQSIHDQQRQMLNLRTHRIEHRIVNLQQPHVRPIVRGKAEHETEFGQYKRRLSMSRVMDRLQTSSETVIAITILTANLIRWEQDIFLLLHLSFLTSRFFHSGITGLFSSILIGGLTRPVQQTLNIAESAILLKCREIIFSKI